MITLLVITDGRRDCIAETIPSAEHHLRGPITRRVLYDDSGDPDHRAWLAEQFPTFELIHHPAGRQGFGGAIRTAWLHVAAGRFVFHLEDDFTFHRDVDLAAMADVLDAHPYLVQLALRRQAWNDAEIAAGGVIEQHPAAYVEHVDERGRHWLEHRLFFTSNPSLYRRALCRRGWPLGRESEGRFSQSVLADDPARAGYWGERSDKPWVHHIGQERVGVNY